MSSLKVTGIGGGYTLISNVFIDQYMVTAGSSHLKTYLLLMRLYMDPLSEISVSHMADVLDCSESDVLRSLRYWKKKGLMELQFAEDTGELTGIRMMEPKGAEEGGQGLQDLSAAESELAAVRAPRKEKGAGSQKTTAGSAPSAAQPVPTAGSADSVSGDVVPVPDKTVDFGKVSADENFSRILFIAEQYIGSPLSRNDCETFAWMYDRLEMETGLMEYLVEYCVTNGHRSIRYMEAVAIDWHQKQIRTVEQAKIYTPLHDKNLYAVMKALGLNGRQPAPGEREIIDGWFRNYGFSLDMVVEACNRTMISIHEPNLNYVESILSRWKKAGISGLDQVKTLDEEYQKKKAAAGKDTQQKTGRHSGQQKAGAQFHSFEQRTYDYDALQKTLSAVSDGNRHSE
ncbi:MAG: DnaD domain protein [Lachnospiraceae bacterium]|nr:DnaD domain protein [Lachnospiraceae bacterium]